MALKTDGSRPTVWRGAGYSLLEEVSVLLATEHLLRACHGWSTALGAVRDAEERTLNSQGA